MSGGVSRRVLVSTLSEPGVDAPTAGSVAPRLSALVHDAYLAQALVRQVLKAQIQGAIDTSNELATTVIHEAQETHASARQLIEFVGVASSAAAKVLARVTAAIDSADVLEHDVLEQQSRRLEQASARSRKLAHEQRLLERIGEKAHDLGMRIRIVAMNTNIQSFRSGTSTNAGAIGALAREIGALAIEVQKLGLDLRNSLGDLSRAIDREMVEGIAREAEAIEEVRTRLAAQVSGLRESHDQLAKFQSSVLKQVEESGHSVSKHAYNTLGGIQSQDILRQRLEQVMQVLALMAERDEVLQAALLGRAPLPEDWKPLSADELHGQYVMQAQRTAHVNQTHDEAAQEGDGPAIELF